MHLQEIPRYWPEPSQYKLRWRRGVRRQRHAGGSYRRTEIQLGGCGDSNRAAVDSPGSSDKYWKTRSTCLLGPPALQPELKRFSRDTDYWRWQAVSSSNWSGNFGYSVQTTRRERHIIAQRNWNKPLLQQMKRTSWRSTLTNEIAQPFGPMRAECSAPAATSQRSPRRYVCFLLSEINVISPSRMMCAVSVG